MDTRLATRLATTADVPIIVELVNEAFVVERFFKHADRTNADEISRLLSEGGFFIGEQQGSAVATVYFSIDGDGIYIGMLSVRPGIQRSGIGRSMMEAAEDHARKLGCTHADLRVVNLRTELPPYYRKLGYKETGTAPWIEGVYSSEPCHFILMSKPL